MTQNYKRTELGLVPTDWEVLSLYGNFDFFPNNTYARNCMNSSKGIVQNIHYGDVLIKFDSILDCDRVDIPYINPELPINFARRLIQAGDIIMANTAEDNTVGKAVEVINVGSRMIVSGLHTIFIRPRANLFAERYLGYFMNSSVYHDQLLPYIVGTKVSSVSKASLLETMILRPPLPEQRAIATALSDVDGYIAALERLIAKKQNIKKGAMQELLTGKRRLPGFGGAWIKKRIDEIGETNSGGTPSRSISKYFGGNIPWVTTSELKDNYIFTTLEKITEEAIQNSSAKLFPKGTLLMAMYGATIGKLGILQVDATTNQACCAFFFDKNTDTHFMFNILLHNRREIIELGSGAGQPNISQTIIKQLTFSFPPTKAEQAAIAKVLSDMDAEINALAVKLEKVRRIKQGMVQELLTGCIRLVDTNVPMTQATASAAMIIEELPKNEP